MKEYGLIHLTARTWAVCTESSHVKQGPGGENYKMYAICTKPLPWGEANQALTALRLRNYAAMKEDWFPDNLPLDRG